MKQNGGFLAMWDGCNPSTLERGHSQEWWRSAVIGSVVPALCKTVASGWTFPGGFHFSRAALGSFCLQMSRNMTLHRAVHVNSTSPAPPTRPKLSTRLMVTHKLTKVHCKHMNVLAQAWELTEFCRPRKGMALPPRPWKVEKIINMGTEQLHSLTCHWIIWYVHQGPTGWELLTGDKGRLQVIRIYMTRPIRTVIPSTSVYLSGLSSVLCLETAPHGSARLYSSALHLLPQ